nr:MAG TPA: hypothetical protein [Caudoviricetes sp.]
MTLIRSKKNTRQKSLEGYPSRQYHIIKRRINVSVHEQIHVSTDLSYPKEQYITSTTLVDVRWSPLEESNLTTSIPRFYVIGLEDRCGDRGLYLDKILLLIRNIFTLVIQMG